MESCPKTISPLNEKEKNQAHNGTSNDLIEVESKDKGIYAHTLNKKLFFAGEQWSVEENNIDDSIGDASSSTVNGFSYPKCKEQNTLTIPSSNKHTFTHNNNLIDDKTNLTCIEDKPNCFYLKFPMKVNNNIYHEKSLMESDGMEEYFEQNEQDCDPPVSNLPCSSNSVCNGSVASNGSQLNIAEKRQNLDCSLFDDQINALNGEEEDEDDGCIYTYKGDNYEANLSHLIETCFSCGLPTTERPTMHHGAVSIQRILNGSQQPNPNPQGNLYSPEMDFLEMDFDPGSNGEGPDSDCEDNSVLNIDETQVENHSDILLKIDPLVKPKTNNIPREIRSLLCRRCEMCMYNEQKVNNTSTIVSQTHNDSKLYKPSYSVLDDRPQIPKELNVKDDHGKNSFSKLLNDHTDFSNVSPSNIHQMEDIDKENIENNLNFAEDDFNPEFSDGAEDADDEDDSTSEHPPMDVLHPSRRNSSSSYFCPSSEKCNLKVLSSKRRQVSNQLSSTSERLTNGQVCTDPKDAHSISANLVMRGEECANLNCKIPNHIFTEKNNNLGSISAPEVSPAKEFSPLEKFSRSASFHNQLSSPKYENVCFSHLKNNLLNSTENHLPCANCAGAEYCSCKFGFNTELNVHTREAANLEACTDRLSQREKSVFNISSSSTSYMPPVSGPPFCESPKLPNTSIHLQQKSHYTSISTYPSEGTGSNRFADNVTISNHNGSVSAIPQENCDVLPLTSLDLMSPLSFKSLQPKCDDPSKDPNTASDDDYSSSPAKDFENNKIPKTMIWTERQATLRQVSQIGKSACGATAVINVLLSLDHPRPIKIVTAAINTRMRAEDARLVDYLLSRSNAGTTHEDLIKGIENISDKSITGRFFHMFPKRSFQLSRWLIHWIEKGGVPVATLNLQVGVHLRQTIPDFWHHQMVFGVGPQGIYLTNPLECVSDSLLSEQLCSDSVLLVRRSDLVSRWDMKDHLIRLSLQPDPRWNDMSVLGQVVGILKEHTAPEMLYGRRHLTSHVTIPAAYQSGVTIFMRADNPHLCELKEAAELPLLE